MIYRNKFKKKTSNSTASLRLTINLAITVSKVNCNSEKSFTDYD